MSYEINASALETDSREFPIVKDALFGRYHRLYDDHVPDGRLIRGLDVSQRQLVAGSYTAIIRSHTQTVVGAFGSELYASGFALLRPTAEATLKQLMVADYPGDDDGWKKIPNRPLRITKTHIKQLEERSGCDILPWWDSVKPLLNDFVHGGTGQLTSNPIGENGHVQYPAAWFWSAMLITTMCALLTSSWFWEHIGYEERAKRILGAVTGEDWATITVMRNGQPVRVIGR